MILEMTPIIRLIAFGDSSPTPDAPTCSQWVPNFTRRRCFYWLMTATLDFQKTKTEVERGG